MSTFRAVDEWYRRSSGCEPSYDDARDWLVFARNSVLEEAAAVGASAREWACTLLVAACSLDFAVFLQVGDGAIVARRGGVAAVVFWPDNGEYANETFFLSDQDSVNRARASLVRGGFSDLAVISDGMQMLSLRLATQSAHLPFFEPLWSELRASDETNEETFGGRLSLLLSSPLVNARTDDDKTLVLASWVAA